MHLLFVGERNACRSPTAELLCAHWARGLVPAGSERPRVSSAGLTATPGEPIDRRVLAALAERGVEVDGFQARPLTVDMAESADLVLCMTGDQRRRVLETRPRLLRRTFALLEAAALLPRVATDDLRPLGLHERARELARRLDAARPLRTPAGASDVPEPSGRRRKAYAASVEQIASAVQPLCAVLFEARPAAQGRGAASQPLAV